MSDSRSRPARRPASGKRQSVGGPERGGNLPVVFIGAMVAAVLAFVVLLTVAADAFGGGDAPASPGVETPTETASSEPPTSGPSSGPATTAPTTPPTVDSNGAIIVACGDILAPLDKQHRVERSCVPSDLQSLPAEFSSGTQRMRAESRSAMIEFLGAAKQAGYAMYLNSSYRGFEEQSATYDYWVSQYGKEYADRTSARPGHSEHQMGTTADIGWQGCELECTIGSPEADWIAQNAYKFGFIVSYPQGKEQITGYAYEPWHVRYVGKATALEVQNTGLTLHEFLLK